MLVDISLCPPSFPTDKSYSNSNEIEYLGMISLGPINVYLALSEISSSLPKIVQVLP